MNNLPWFRFYSAAVDNEKLRLIAFEDRWHFVAILCCKQQGIIDGNKNLLNRKLAVKLGIQLRDLDEIKRRLIEVELIDEEWNPIGWEEKQYKSDSSSERTRRYRDKNKMKQSETSQERHSDLLDTDTDTDTEVNPIDTNVSIVMNEKPIHDEMKQEIILDSEPLKIDSDIPDCPHKEIIDCYKNILPEAIHPRTWDGGRMTAIKSRWRESKNRQSIDWWRRFFEYIRQSDFLMGRALALNRQPFEIRLDWIVKKENFNKIIDGVYENRQRTA